MKYTIALPQSNRVGTPNAIRDVAQAADELGFWALSMHDHIFFDGGLMACGSDLDSGTQDIRTVYEPMTTYAHVAALTKQVELLFGIMLLPARETLMAAKQLATLDQLSGGRVLLGIGVGLGGNETDPEFLPVSSKLAAKEWRALGVPARKRGKLTDERIAAMQALWSEGTASYDGELVSFTDVPMFPKPAQSGGIPILIAGTSPAALRRTAKGGFGWLPSHLEPVELAGAIEELKKLHDQYDTDFAGEVVVDVYMRPDESRAKAIEAFPGMIKDVFGPALGDRNLLGTSEDLATRLTEYAAAGATAMNLKPIYHSVDELIASMERFAREVVPVVPSSSVADIRETA
ncbi:MULTISPECIES: TIGR03619 family F420-dependent LLM class oxidoreductase [unclassified Rhodococcus (in: high G+C Gram-positive bacteria)]|uniref:TIGR03619 family F420-dependent LLM class oxidoreductase n=1 Tax=unclassified Rhodococcus (in: high G+C Gram-positive bacteria) TaxID=192944 RepID=UPI0021C21692|nr:MULTISPECIES: TIGR03619 family F420-dependent LLM class oxidoreductase [unclassified Rhodococcus (in: high G+C Gram-positive bacteria)]